MDVAEALDQPRARHGALEVDAEYLAVELGARDGALAVGEEGLAQHVEHEARRRLGSHLEVGVPLDELAEGRLAPDVGEVLPAQLIKLDALHLHRVDHEPRRHLVQQLRLRPALRVGQGGGRVSRLAELALHQLPHLRNDKHRDGLPLADAAHAEGALREVAEDHVLAERERGARGERVFDVHAGGVDLCAAQQSRGR